jgi:hypothetical protein
MTDSGVDSEPSPSSPDSDARSASPRLMTLLRRSASPSGMTLLRRSASPAACAVIRRSEPAAAILLNTWHSAEGSAAAAAAATSATEEDDDDEEEEEEEKITLYRSEEDCEHPPSSILRLESATSSTVRLENPSSAPSVSLENPSSSSSSCSQLESLETVEEKMETVEALLSLSDSSRSPLASPEKQSGQPPGTGKNKEWREEKPDSVFLHMYGLHFLPQQYSKMTLMVCLYSELYSLKKTLICFNLKFGHILCSCASSSIVLSRNEKKDQTCSVFAVVGYSFRPYLLASTIHSTVFVL